MRELLFIFFLLQLSEGCHQDLRRAARALGTSKRRGRLFKGGGMESYIASNTCPDVKEYCAFLPCQTQRDFPGPLPCRREYCQCGAPGIITTIIALLDECSTVLFKHSFLINRSSRSIDH